MFSRKYDSLETGLRGEGLALVRNGGLGSVNKLLRFREGGGSKTPDFMLTLFIHCPFLFRI